RSLKSRVWGGDIKGVSNEEVLLRFEHANSAYNAFMNAKEARKASLEAQRRRAARGELPPTSSEGDASSKEHTEAERRNAMLENEDELWREQREAKTALMAALYGLPCPRPRRNRAPARAGRCRRHGP